MFDSTCVCVSVWGCVCVGPCVVVCRQGRVWLCVDRAYFLCSTHTFLHTTHVCVVQEYVCIHARRGVYALSTHNVFTPSVCLSYGVASVSRID